MLDDLLQDLRAGHNIVFTVAVECRYGYRNDGPDELRPVGEIEFLESIADRVAIDPTITSRIAAAIVGHANLLLGDAVAPVLEAHMAASPAGFAAFVIRRHGMRATRCAAKRHEGYLGTTNSARAWTGWQSWASALMLGFITHS